MDRAANLIVSSECPTWWPQVLGRDGRTYSHGGLNGGYPMHVLDELLSATDLCRRRGRELRLGALASVAVGQALP